MLAACSSRTVMEICLDHDVCYRAIQTKDVRFDGRLFVAVRTTGVYCRPVCPAQTPKRENCTFYPSAAAAQSAGFRPCLRCRPELSPHLFAQIGTETTVRRALRLIAEGALDEGSVEDLARRLGVGDRHLRQLFNQHLGTSPTAVAQTRRVLFAKQLLDETSLSMTDIAMAAGFSSIRRFNDVMQQIYQRSPSQLRRSSGQSETNLQTSEITLKLPFSPPYPWQTVAQWFSTRITPGLESVRSDYYRRTIDLEGHQGVITICPVPDQNYLLANICFPKVAALAQIVERLRRMFDLNANVVEIASHLHRDRILSPLVKALPGLRILGAWNSFEFSVRAILGQQVSVAAATTLAGRLVATYGEPLRVAHLDSELRWVYPRPEVLATADLTSLGIVRTRAIAIQSLANVVAEDPQFLDRFQSLEDAVYQLRQLPGIGEWTAQYIAMRALGEPNAFPATDLGLIRAMEKLGHPMTAVQLLDVAQAWQPWRAYAAMYLWSSNLIPIAMKEIVSA
jgi:AraC family transcriptional regulator, regulatory protein of adaptative response / DNA-3-methyladenine glycosylase II